MGGGGSRRDPASPRAVAAYLVQLRAPLNQATQARKTWVQNIGVLMEDARRGNPMATTQAAGRIGHEHGTTFRDARQNLKRLAPPPGCDKVHTALDRWLDKLIACCDVLVEVARQGEVRRLRETQTLFADGRRHARDFNEEYARLVTDLKSRVAAASRAPVTRPRRPVEAA